MVSGRCYHITQTHLPREERAATAEATVPTLSWGNVCVAECEGMSGCIRVLTRWRLRGWRDTTDSLLAAFSTSRACSSPSWHEYRTRVPMTIARRCVSRTRAKSAAWLQSKQVKSCFSRAAVGWRLEAMSPSLSQPHFDLNGEVTSF